MSELKPQRPTPEEVELAKIAAAELRSTVCVCGHRKKEEQSLCRLCFSALPVPMRAGLYAAFRDGYVANYHEAKRWLQEHTDRLKAGAA